MYDLGKCLVDVIYYIFKSTMTSDFEQNYIYSRNSKPI